MTTQEIIDSLLPMKDPDERIAVISAHGNQFDYFARKVISITGCKAPVDCYDHVHLHNPERLRGIAWTKVILLNNPNIDCRAERILDHLRGKGIPVVNVDNNDI